MDRLEILNTIYTHAEKNNLIKGYYDVLMNGSTDSEMVIKRLEKGNFKNEDDLMAFVANDILEILFAPITIPPMPMSMN